MIRSTRVQQLQAEMTGSTSKAPASCLCSQGKRASRWFMQKVCPNTKPTRSGRCAGCGVARRREGKILSGDAPEFAESNSHSYSYMTRYFADVGTGDRDTDKRISVLRVVARLPVDLDHEQERRIADRVYAQLQLERNPLVDPEVSVNECPEEAFGRLYVILSEHVPSFRNHVCPIQQTMERWGWI
ncbi:hypothetical protein GGR53DRAFT_305551 [Hypoxylon sp. FL1150]|nr:hypothetical protein GGR53DRAFT_305551 [Hypoxylon sp. FL1150]